MFCLVHPLISVTGLCITALRDGQTDFCTSAWLQTLPDPQTLLSEQPQVSELIASKLLQFLDTLGKFSMGQLFLLAGNCFTEYNCFVTQIFHVKRSKLWWAWLHPQQLLLCLLHYHNFKRAVPTPTPSPCTNIELERLPRNPGSSAGAGERRIICQEFNNLLKTKKSSQQPLPVKAYAWK